MTDSGSNRKCAAAEADAAARTLRNQHKVVSLRVGTIAADRSFPTGTEVQGEACEEHVSDENTEGDSNRWQQIDGANYGACESE